MLVHPEKLLEPAAAGRASFRSIACAPYKPTKRFYLFFLFPSKRARRSFVVSANRQRSPFVYLHGTRLVSPPCIFVYMCVLRIYWSRLAHSGDDTRCTRCVAAALSRCRHARHYDISRANLSRTVLGCSTVATVNSTWNTVGTWTTILFSAVCNAGQWGGERSVFVEIDKNGVGG